MSDVPETLAAALAALQADLPPIDKAATANAGTYTYTYAKLSAISRAIFPRLAEYGLSFIAKPTMSDGQFVLAYSLLHTSGQREDGAYPLGTGTPQQLGSAISYGRRYCLCAVTGLAPDDEDDDGVAASAQPRRRAAKKSTSPPPGDDGGQDDQTKRMFALMRDRGLTDRDLALAFVSDTLGRKVESRNDLTAVDKSRVIDALAVNPGFEGKP